MTHDNVMNYLNRHYSNNVYKLIGDTLHIYEWVSFEKYPYRELPGKMVFHSACDLAFSMIEKLPNDIVLYGGLYCYCSRMNTLPETVHYNFINLNMCCDVNISYGVFVGGSVYSPKTKYEHLTNIRIDGFFVNNGIIS